MATDIKHDFSVTHTAAQYDVSKKSDVWYLPTHAVCQFSSYIVLNTLFVLVLSLNIVLNVLL